jgi:hypothetical protein
MSAAQNTALKAVTLDHPINTKASEQWVDLTPTLAEKWLGQNHENRNLRSSKVRAFARDMRNGEWTTTGQPIQFDWNGNLIDGQHRCEAVIESGVTVRVLVVKGLDPKAKQVIDTGTKRTPADALKFSGYKHDLNATAAVARIAMGRDAGYLRTAFAGSAPNITNAETVSWVDVHPEVTNAVALARRTGKQIGIAPSPWAYCLWELQHINGAIAVEFATSMHEYRGLRGKGDPRVAMLTAFRNAQQGQRRIPQVAESIYIVFRAWNAWVANKSLVSVIPRDPNGKGNDIPKLIAPTAAFFDRYGL